MVYGSPRSVPTPYDEILQTSWSVLVGTTNATEECLSFKNSKRKKVGSIDLVNSQGDA